MQTSIMRHASLFSGIGGFDLAAQWMKWKNIFQCEIDPFCRALLNFHFPNSVCYGDIKKTDFRKHRGLIDILTGGFPCQPFSVAGKRLGKKDDRHLWPDMLRAIHEIRPRWVVAENVPGIINWNEGMVFEEVQSQLEAEGYSVQAYVLPAASIGAPHQRKRVWFIAYAARYGYRRSRPSENRPQAKHDQGQRDQRQWIWSQPEGIGATSVTPDPSGQRRGTRGDIGEVGSISSDHGITTKNQPQWENRKCGPGSPGSNVSDSGIKGLEGTAGLRISLKSERKTFLSKKSSGSYRNQKWENFPQAEPTICFGDDGVSAGLDSPSFSTILREALTGITLPKWRMESIKALGNAIVPQIAYAIFKAVRKYEQKIKQ